MIDYSKILNNLYVGAYLKDGNDAFWLKEKIDYTGVLNLQTDADLVKRKVNLSSLKKFFDWAGVSFVRHPIQDYSASDLRWQLPEAVQALKQLLDRGFVVYLHCNSGINRSPTVAIAYLHWHQKMPLFDAIDFFKKRRKSFPIIGSLMSMSYGYYCSDCSNEQNDPDKCEKCGSDDLMPQSAFAPRKTKWQKKWWDNDYPSY